MVIYSIAIIVTTFTNITRLTSGVRDIILYPSQADKTKSRGWVLTDWVVFKPTVNVASYPCSFFFFYFSLWYLLRNTADKYNHRNEQKKVMCGFHSSYQYSLFGQIGFVDIFVEYKSLQKVIMMTTVLQVYVCRIRESQSCGFGSEETCSRQRFSLWARDRPGLKLLSTWTQNMYPYYIFPIKIWYTKISNWFEVEMRLSWSANYYYFQVDWAEP